MIYRFGEFQLDAERYCLLREGSEVPLEPRTLDLLVFLVENRGRVVGRQELLEEVWGGQHVEEAAVTQAVHSLRAALGDGSRDPSFVLTVRGRGYRFAGSVEVEEGGDLPSSVTRDPPGDTDPLPEARRVSGVRRLRMGSWLFLGGVALAVLVALLPRSGPGEDTDTGPGSLGLLPLVNATGDESLHWVELGLIDLLGRRLEASGDLVLIPATETLAVLQRGEPGERTRNGEDRKLATLARATGARWLVSTVLTREGGIFRIRATLADRDGAPRSDTLSGGDLFGLTETLAGTIGIWVTGNDRVAPGARSIDYPEAPELRELFASGMQEQLQGDPRAALRFFDLVLAEDPESTAAGYEKAIALRKLGETDQATRLAEALLADALADGSLRLEGKVRNLLGILEWIRGDMQAAATHYERSLEIHRLVENPKAEISNLINLGILASGWGEWDLAQSRYGEALSLCGTLGVPCPAVYNSLGVDAWTQGDVERSGRMHREALSLRRQTGDRRGEAASLHNLGIVAWALGRLGEAEDLLGQALVLRRELEDRRGVVSTLVTLADLSLDRGRFADAEELLAEGLELVEERGFERENGRILGGMAELAAARGDRTTAVELSDRVLDIYRAMGERPLVTRELGRQVELAVESGQLEKATRILAEMAGESEALDNPQASALLEAARARGALARGSTAEGLESLGLAVDLARDARNPSLERELTLRMSEELLDRGEISEARRRLASLGVDRGEVWGLHWVHGRLAFAEGEPDAALRSAVRARELAGDHWGAEQEAFLEELRRAVGRRSPAG